MLSLAIEQSTEHGSAALFLGGELRGAAAWRDARFRSQGLFDGIRRLLAAHTTSLAQIERYVVGLGPGSFTGLRAAVAAVRAMALPSNTPVYGLSSVEALPCGLADRAGMSSVVVVGDARRGYLWAATLERQGAFFMRRDDWELLDIARLPILARGHTWIVTPDWDKLGPALKAACPTGTRLLEEPCIPSAECLGRAAAARESMGMPSDPLVPIYLHPPVTAGGNAKQHA